MIDNIIIPKKDNPVLLDKIIQDLQDTLSSKLKWLNYAFGRAYKIVEHRPDGNKFIYPAIYIGNAEYVSVLPNDKFGNFAWFDIYDPQELQKYIPGLPQLSFKGAIIFWYDQSTIYPDATKLYTEEIKNKIISVLTKPGITRQGRLSISTVYERFENIYKGYSIEKIYNNNLYKGEGIASIDRQFFMYPYAGLRIEFTMLVKEYCKK